MTGHRSDPRLLGAAWANEERLADGQTETGQARRHRVEDRDAARARTTAAPARRRRGSPAKAARSSATSCWSPATASVVCRRSSPWRRSDVWRARSPKWALARIAILADADPRVVSAAGLGRSGLRAAWQPARASDDPVAAVTGTPAPRLIPRRRLPFVTGTSSLRACLGNRRAAPSFLPDAIAPAARGHL
jgi:hypothetical protein